MANVTSLAYGGTSGVADSSNMPENITIVMDIAEAVAAGLLTTEYAVVLNIPAETLVEIVDVKNYNALSMGSGPAISLGDSGSATRFVNGASTLTALTHHTIATASRLFTSADTLRLTLTGGTLASGKIGIKLRLTDVSNNGYPLRALA